jgi:hypothetical protein
MRLGYFIVILFAMYVGMGLIDQTMNPQLQAYGNGASGAFFSSLIQPWNWQDNSLIQLLGASVVIAVGIAAGASFISRSDIATLASLAYAFMALGAIPIVMFYSFVTRNVATFVTDCQLNPALACGPANIIGGLTAGVLGLFYVFTVLEWWMWRPTTQ